MIQNSTKAIKGLPKRAILDLRKNQLTTLKEKVRDLYLEHVWYPIEGFFYRYSERIKRSFDWAVKGWVHHDWEGAYLYDVMAWKMKRMHAALLSGSAIHNKEDLDALKEAEKICKRLFNGNYEEPYRKVHDKKWGSLKMKTTPDYDENGKVKYYSAAFSRRKAKTKSQKAKESAESMEIYKKAEQDRVNDIDRLAVLLKTYEPRWWD